MLVFATALCCLTYELVLSRLVDFHLGADNAYLALPIAFLGLALGSLYVHFRPNSAATFNLNRELGLLAALCVGGLLFSFVFFSWVMPVTSTMVITEQLGYLAKKTAAFVVVMILPFFSFGRILTSIYQLRRDEIGSIYAADLLGAALACGLTPVAFAFGGLPTVIVVLILLSFVPWVLATSDKRKRIILIVTAVLISIGSERLIDYSDRTVSYAQWGTETQFSEIQRAWNEHSRVALVKRMPKEGTKGKPVYAIIHNNSRSNVHVWRYRDRDREVSTLSAMEAPWIMGRAPQNVLVMFAGTGAEMLAFDELAHRKAAITGVEINGLVEKIGRTAKVLKPYRIAEFLDQDRINLVIDEGRHFLTTRPKGTQYDLIYLGSNAPTTAVTGHTTKYLDTLEAYDTYLDLLGPGGLMVFDHQPLEQRIHNLREVFARRGIDNFEDHVVIIDDPHRGDDDMLIAPDGFTDAELDAMIAMANSKGKNRRKIRYMSARGKRDKRYAAAIEGEITRTFVDDRPFMMELDVTHYKLFPGETKKTLAWYMSWIKITTVVLLSGIALLFIGVAAIKRDSRAPIPVLLYLLLTGFCFMLCEVAIMAKLELFLTQPLLSMAAVLSLFLLTSGVGSAVYPRIPKLHDTRLLAGLAVVAVMFVMYTLHWMVGGLLHLPVALKLVIATVVTAPLGVVLGLFYPHVVSCLIDQKREQTVSISYGLSTLASVVGSAYALAAMINLGFNALLEQAAVGYGLLLVFALIYIGLGGRWLSRGAAVG